MKKIFILGALLISGLTFAQTAKPVLEQEGNLVKATYYYENGKYNNKAISKTERLPDNGLLLMKTAIKNQLENILTEKKPANGFFGTTNH